MINLTMPLMNQIECGELIPALILARDQLIVSLDLKMMIETNALNKPEHRVCIACFLI